jgi:ribosomal protein S27AE
VESVTTDTDNVDTTRAEVATVVTGIQCPRCSDVIVSEHRHDWRTCKCGLVFVDGGRDYLRCGFTEDGTEFGLPTVVELSR